MPLNAIKNYVKEELPGIYEAGKFLRDRAEDFNENREQVFEGVQQQLNGKDSTQINEEVRPIGSEAVLNGQPVFWSGQNYGWQSKGSFDKLMDEGQFRMGSIAAQRIGNSITESIPQEVKDFATEKITDAANAAVDFYQDQDYETQQRINVGLNIANGVVTLADQGLEFISEKTNTSRFITDELAMAALTGGGSAALKRATPAIEQGAKTAIKAIDKYGPTIDNIFPPTPPAALATAGSAPQVQLNVSGGKANLNLAPQVMELTIKDPALVAKGIKKGSAKSPEWIEQTRDFDRRRSAAREKVASATGKSAKKNSISAMYNEVSTGPTRNPGLAPAGDPHAYTDEAFKRRSVIEKLKDGSPKWKEQHHLFSKQESYQFVEKMIELGDDDDVLSMFLFAEDLDATMGGRLSNMLNMERKPHSLLHTSRKRKIDGRELKADEMQNLVNSAKTSTELMELFNKYVTENVLVSIDEAKAFNEISNRMIRNNKYGFIQELYDKNMLRAPVWRDY